MEFLETDDGSLTLRHEVLGELYHSDRGAVGEAEHIYIHAGFDRALAYGDREEIAVFDVGFGTGLNGWLTYCRANEAVLPVRVDYRTIELYPLCMDVVEKLNFTPDPLFKALHRLPWDGKAHELSECFSVTKYLENLLSFDFSPLNEKFDVVYFDAFAPDAQPDLWTEEIMEKMYTILSPGGVLVTYSSKGSVKQALRAVGFEVTRLPGAMGKRHMVRAVKRLN